MVGNTAKKKNVWTIWENEFQSPCNDLIMISLRNTDLGSAVLNILVLPARNPVS